MQRQNLVLLPVVILIWMGTMLTARAHEIRPTIADFRLTAASGYEITLRANAEALIAGIGAEHSDTDDSPTASTYDALRQLPPAELAQRFEIFANRLRGEIGISFDGAASPPETVRIQVPPVGDTDLPRDSIVTLTGTAPERAQTLEWRWPAAYGASVIRLDAAPGEEEGYSAYLRTGETSDPIPLAGAKAAGFWQIASDYLVIGFTHIIPKGLDHILFVVGLFLLSTRLAPLLWQVTAFTLAHTVTLALGILGYVSISPAIVEPLIALSIVYVAVENILTDRLHNWRPLVVFGFGLLHGLGFAGVLGEIGLSGEYFVTGLIAFNLGVEFGQLAVIALCYLTVGYWFGGKRWYRPLVAVPASLLIAVVASWWVYERVFIA